MRACDHRLVLALLPLDPRVSAPVSDYYTPARRLARVRAERARLGWSWESNQRKRKATIGHVLAVKGTVCHLCGRPGADSADHVIPRSQGGTHALDNLQPAHAACNSARGDTPLEQWRATRPAHRPAPAPSRQWTA